MNAVLATRQQCAPRNAVEARQLHLLSQLRGHSESYESAVLAGEYRRAFIALTKLVRVVEEMTSIPEASAVTP
jgi:hypothetical protein